MNYAETLKQQFTADHKAQNSDIDLNVFLSNRLCEDLNSLTEKLSQAEETEKPELENKIDALIALLEDHKI